jgi:2-oxoglutarate/2-oxoacid ferredoxin oxidoreductase subunit alpha
MPIDLNFMVGGEAGQGIQTIGFVLGKTMARGGFHVFADQDYESRIRGGHNFYRVRVKDQEVLALDEKLDVLIALNKETVEKHRSELKKGS